MGDMQSDRTAMARAARLIEAKHQQIHALQERLGSQMMSMSQRWHGQTSAEIQYAYSKFDTEFERVKQGLDSIHISLVENTRERTRDIRLSGIPTSRRPLVDGARR